MCSPASRYVVAGRGPQGTAPDRAPCPAATRGAAQVLTTQAGTLNLFIQHTSAALSLNENFDRDVRTDMDMVRRVHGCR